jgi:uncharacterized protein YuzE
MKLHFDRAADALYLRLSDSPIQDSAEVSPGIVLDYDAGKQVVAIEVRGVSKRGPNFDPTKLHLETV